MTAFNSRDYSNISVLQQSSAYQAEDFKKFARNVIQGTLTDEDIEISGNLVDQLHFGIFGRLQIIICSLCCCGDSQKMIADKVAKLISPLLDAITPQIAAQNAGRSSAPAPAAIPRRVEVQPAVASPVSAAAARTPVVTPRPSVVEPTPEEIQAHRVHAREIAAAQKARRAARPAVAPTPVVDSPKALAEGCDFKKPVRLLFRGEDSAEIVSLDNLEGALRIRHRQGNLFINSTIAIDGVEILIQDNPTLKRNFELVSFEADERTAKMANSRSQGLNGAGTFVLATQVAAAARRRAAAQV